MVNKIDIIFGFGFLDLCRIRKLHPISDLSPSLNFYPRCEPNQTEIFLKPNGTGNFDSVQFHLLFRFEQPYLFVLWAGSPPSSERKQLEVMPLHGNVVFQVALRTELDQILPHWQIPCIGPNIDEHVGSVWNMTLVVALWGSIRTGRWLQLEGLFDHTCR